MSDHAYLSELKEFFATVPFWEYLGVVIEEVDAGYSLLTLEVQKHHLNGNQTVHGGVYASLLDNAMGLASRAAGGRVQATSNLNIHYLASADQGRLYARGRVIHRTRRTVTTEARVETEDGTLLAVGTGTFRVLQSTSE